ASARVVQPVPPCARPQSYVRSSGSDRRLRAWQTSMAHNRTCVSNRPAALRHGLGGIARPRRIQLADSLPRTVLVKIPTRLVRTVVTQLVAEPGDHLRSALFDDRPGNPNRQVTGGYLLSGCRSEGHPGS